MVNPRDRIPPEKRCEWVKEDGSRCQNPKMPGSRYCYSHSRHLRRQLLRRSFQSGFEFSCNKCKMKEVCPYYEKDAQCAVILPIKHANMKNPEKLLEVWEWILKRAVQSYSRELWRAELEGKSDKEIKRHLERITKAFDAFAKALAKFEKRQVKSIEELWR